MVAGSRFDPLGFTREQQDRSAPGLGVFSGWLGGVSGWLGGGWWLQQRGGMTQREMADMKAKEPQQRTAGHVRTLLALCHSACVCQLTR